MSLELINNFVPVPVPMPVPAHSRKRLSILKDRALMLSQSRKFFADRNIMEVDVPLLSRFAPVDLHIDLILAKVNKETCYLNSSPEYAMKKLLVEGIGDIYQLSHVFRNGEIGHKHNPEFTMVEWYRHTLSFEKLMEETVAFARLFIEDSSLETYSYEEAFLHFSGKKTQNCHDRDYVFAFEIEPKMKGFTLVYDFPKEDAALALVEGAVAKRFELYYNGCELANGYQELGDAQELKRRFEGANAKRLQSGKEAYPIDMPFLEAMEKGFPQCVGVAVGFDRLMMLRHNVTHIKEVIPFAWH